METIAMFSPIFIKTKLGHPLFLFSVLLLILNDWWFKAAFSNPLTGKLSDFAGLFAFPFLLATLFPKHPKSIHITTAIFFVFWKASWSEPLILFLQQLHIPLHRTIDFSDNMALISVLLSYHLNKTSKSFTLKPAVFNFVLIGSSLAFMATSMQQPLLEKGMIGKSYHFNLSKRELISAFNAVQLKEVAKYKGLVDFDKERNVFHFYNSRDTLAYPLDYLRVGETDTISYQNSYAALQFLERGPKSSTLILVQLAWNHHQKNGQQKAIRLFEKKVIKPIRQSERRYGHSK